MERIITSLLDNDLYTFTVGQVAFKYFRGAKVQYQFINRGKTRFPTGFVDELKRQLELMKELKLTEEELAYLTKLGHFSQDYLDFIKAFRFDPTQITITEHDGNLSAEFNGEWETLIMWEVPFLALVSELYYKLMGAQKDDKWIIRIVDKAEKLDEAACRWMEFGTRRRFDFATQEKVVAVQKHYNGFLGTSNVFLAMKYDVPCNGTMSHQGPMAMQAKYGAAMANSEWRKAWRNCYGNKLNTFLPDTFTTKVFLQGFDNVDATQWNLRQDSGNPYQWMTDILLHYLKLGINPKGKTAVFSDSLNPELFIHLTQTYRKYINVVGGIGTNLSNDCGHKALSIVIKLTGGDFGEGFVDVVKLSDDPVKHTGKPEAIAKTKAELGLV
jgi:nicotinate phosphoribosyltransferase